MTLSLSEIRAAVLERDWFQCVRCGEPVTSSPASIHHRPLQDRSNNAAANLIVLDGTGVARSPALGKRRSPQGRPGEQCHPWAHANSRAAKSEGGYIVSRSTPAGLIAAQPVFYNQQGRTGWFLLNDDFTLTPWEAA